MNLSALAGVLRLRPTGGGENVIKQRKSRSAFGMKPLLCPAVVPFSGFLFSTLIADLVLVGMVVALYWTSMQMFRFTVKVQEWYYLSLNLSTVVDTSETREKEDF